MKARYVLPMATAALLFAGYWLVNSTSVAADGPGGSINGTVKFQGVAPKSTRIDMSFDPLCAKAHPSPALTEDVVVASDGSLEGAIVYVSHGLEGQTFPTPAQPVVLEQKGCMYLPHVVALQANQKLQVVNSDQTTHNIHPTPANNREWNMTQPPGTPMEQTFAREEIAIPVKCNVHPWMRGYIAVFKHPFFAVTGKDGTFEIKNLPPGNYTIQSWHGKLGMQMQQVTVSAGQAQKLDFTYKQ
jgi:plastocyanin